MIKLGSNNISKIYLGGNSIGKAYLGSNLVFQKGGGVQPVMIPYIRGGADGSYIDTGITPDSTMRVIVWARNFNPGIQPNTMLFGSREETVETNSIQFLAGITNNTGRMFARFGDRTAYLIENDFRNFGHYHKYELRPNGVYIDDSLKVSVSVPATMSNNYSLFLFACNNAGVRSENLNLPIDICACKIYKNDVLVRDFTAVNTPSVGLYDAVSQTLFTNAGSGSFTYGEFNENAYTPLEYIGCTKSQYIDTGIHATGDSMCISKFMITNTEKQYKRLFGVRDAGTKNMFELMVGNTTTLNRYFSVRYNDSYETIDAEASQNSVPLVYVANGSSSSLYKDNVTLGNSVSFDTASYTSNNTIYIASTGGSHDLTYGFYGRIYYIGFGAQGNFVPAKKGSRVGMYDTYNDVFYSSATNTPFIAGPTI